MKRKLTLAMLLSLSTASPLALALGLGEAEVNSTLNAPLRASIPLTDSSGLQADLLNVSVADERAFSSAGLTRTPLAASVKMDVTRRQGRLVVDLTTQRPVREPWLDLLLRFDWPGGQQLQEVTLLLDPPNYDQLPALVGASSAASQAAVPSPRSTAAATRSSSRPVARTSSSAGSGDPAWVRNGDTLWAVAGRLRPDSGISMSQMMVALVEANPEVFPSGNINAMRAGYTLVVPPRQAITVRTDAEADRVVQAMNQAWANRGSGAPARVALGGAGETPASAVASAPSQQGASSASAEQGQPEAASREASASGDDAASEGGQRLTLLSDAELAAEGAVPVDGVSNPQQGGRSTLSLQQNAAPTPLAMPAGSEATGPVIDPGVLGMIQGSGELTEAQRLQRLEARWRENRQALEAVRSERDVLQSQLGNLRDELDAMRDQLAVLTAGGQGVDAAGAGGVVAPGSTADSPQQAPWWGALVQGESSRNLLLGGAGLALLLALWALLRYRRRHDNSDATMVFSEARPVDTSADDLVMPGARPTPQGDAQRVDRPVPVRATMPEAEAINEADIFIAYGRYDQARDLLDASLEREPGRDDLRLKLLRVLLEQGDHESAARQAKQLRDSGDPNILAEVDQLMERHARSAAPADPPAEPPADRAVFPEADELPPRRFEVRGAVEELDAEVEGEDQGERDELPSRDTSSRETSREALRPSQGPRQDASAAERPDPTARYRPPERESEPATRSTPKDQSAAPGVGDAPTQAGKAPEATPLEQEPQQADELPQAPLTARQSQDGSRFIDYRPPTLNTPSAPREETPMQPSVEFTSGSGNQGPADAASDRKATSPEESSPEPRSRNADGPSVATRQAEDGREIIDYRPPALDASSAPREEAPQQPSVEFTSHAVGSDSPAAMPGIRAERDDLEQWDVEEVAFPPLSRDNAHFSAAASATSALAEARRLLDAGEAGQARALLESLIDESDDPDAREEARELLDQSPQ